MSPTNHQVRLAARPSGLPKPTDWSFTEEPVPTPGAGEFVVAISHLSLDPAMRGWMNAGASYIDPVEIGDVMRAGAVGRVIASEHPGFAVGDHVYSDFGVQEYAALRRQGRDQDRPVARPAAHLPRHARPAGHDRLLRPARHRQTEAGRHGRRLGRGRRRRQRRGADRQDQGLPA